MRILCVDIGTGTQDIFLFDSQLAVENGFKLVVPSPTMLVYRKLQEATRRGSDVLLTGLTMGGGPSQWAAEAHIKAGYEVFATPTAAQSFNDDLDVIRNMGIVVISEDEAGSLPDETVRIELKDFDIAAIQKALANFGVDLDGLAATAVAVFDHGAAPVNYSDRLFRFDYIRERVIEDNHLSTFAFRADNIPQKMTRMQSVARSAANLDSPLIVMDTAPAAVLGAALDPFVQARRRVLITNVGNLHTLAFRLRGKKIEGIFEHHTGMLDQAKLNQYLLDLAGGTLQHEDVYRDHGHGAYILEKDPLTIPAEGYGVVVTGPRRGILNGSPLRPYFATPFGDMMLTGCFGLLAATAETMPEIGEAIWQSLNRRVDIGVAPWDI